MEQSGLCDTGNAVPPDAQSEPEATWKEVLHGEREKEYFQTLLTFLEKERAAGKTIYPRSKDTFNALSFTPFDQVKVVIVGQDPYHGPDQAHGLSFSVLPGVRPPPSLVNIFKEIRSDLGLAPPAHGCLESWAKKGVLLLNTVLTVEAAKPGSHRGLGWEKFTDRVIREINQRRQGVVFLLWGAHAQEKCAAIDPQRHHVLKTCHPSPYSAASGFFGCRHFSKANELLTAQGKTPVDWQLPQQ
jgi:uracil-DNA glycosylase